MKKDCPQNIINLAERLDKTYSVNFHFIKQNVAKVIISANTLYPYASFEHPKDQSYGRHLLFEGRRLKVFLMTWTPGDFTAIHDHGNTHWGCVLALGDFTHRVYRIDNGQLKLKSNKPFLKGQVACLNGELIHMMGNAGAENIMSLHIYGSDDNDSQLAKKSRLYFPETKKVITTNGPAFLYCTPDLILEEDSFSTMDEEVLQDYLNLINIRAEKIRMRSSRVSVRHSFA